MKAYIGHIKKRDSELEIQSLDDHLKGTAELCKSFVSKFENPELGEILGLFHDLGKYSDAFQKYILNAATTESDEIRGKVDHSSAGAIYLSQRDKALGLITAYCIAGHHAGLLNWAHEEGVSGDLQSRLSKKELLQLVESHIKQSKPFENVKLLSKMKSEESFNHLVRLLFSCLVDADFLDTERFMNPESFAKRSRFKTLTELSGYFDHYMQQLQVDAKPTEINKWRKSIQDDCIKAGKENHKFFSLSVPTGAGKTLSSMAFAFEHARKYNKERIIIAIPYTSIITQTAHTLKKIFGEDQVIEHHSNFDDSDITAELKLAIENWDAPIIVTTNVQLFESMHGNRPSQCRKLHNMCNSIVILDETQLLPYDFLEPILSSLNAYSELVNTTFLLTTATDPDFYGRIGMRKASFSGLSEKPFEIVKDLDSMYKVFRRTKLEFPIDLEYKKSYTELAEELSCLDQVLCVVNTRKECKEIYDLMPEGTIHLSRMMCSAHIMKNIETIRQKLKNGESVRVISTQLIEAGVDLDFPNVYRAFAGLDSVLQAAGRCNREGQMKEMGKVVVFRGERDAPAGYIRKGALSLKDMLLVGTNENMDLPDQIKQYFKSFQSRLDTFDKKDIKGALCKNSRVAHFQFATAAIDFKLIESGDTVSVFINYDKGADWIKEFKEKGPESWLMRRMQNYCVNLRRSDVKILQEAGAIENIHGVWLQCDANMYSAEAGVVVANKWTDEILIV